MSVEDDIGREMRAYAWPASLASSLHESPGGFDIDFEAALRHVPADSCATQPLVFTVVSESYLPIFDCWLRLARRAGLRRFLVGCLGASAVAKHVRGRGVPCFAIGLPRSFVVETSWRNKGGFSIEGVAAIRARALAALRLVATGHDVLYCDVDAWILRWPSQVEDARVDVAFQRVAYFPAAVVDRWGFALCGGFVFFRASSRTAQWLHRVCEQMKEVSSDQLALNISLLREGATWATDFAARGMGKEAREAHFCRHAALPIAGELTALGLNLLALPATLYWRHAFVEVDRDNCVVMHPNTTKDPVEKLQTLLSLADGVDCESKA